MSVMDRWKVSPEELESRQKLKRVKDAINAPVQAGALKMIDCPYCGAMNTPPNFCCDTMRHAVIAILTGQRMEKIEEAHSRYVN